MDSKRLAEIADVMAVSYTHLVDVLDRNARVAGKLVDRVTDGIDAKLEDATAIHGKHAFAICGSLKRRVADQTGNVQRLDVGRRRKLNSKGILSPSPYERSTRAIAKEHAQMCIRDSPMSVSSDTMPPELPSINISWPNSMPR